MNTLLATKLKFPAPSAPGLRTTAARPQLLAELERRQFGLLLGSSPAMQSIYTTLERAAQSQLTVLLTGETGTGKDLAARTLHAQGPRRDGPFVTVDCGSIPAELLASELFGHRRGAFTGADKDRLGAFEQASGGVIFLDEIGELTPQLQPQLLRSIETGRITPLGSNEEIPIDVTIVAATNRDLREDSDTGRFRSDLYYRIAVLHVSMPALRDRETDLAQLARHFLRNAGVDAIKRERLLDPSMLLRLATYHWPGNVRELKNYVERCAAYGGPAPFHPMRSIPAAPKIDVTVPLRQQREQWLSHCERLYLQDLLVAHNDNVSAAARAAAIARSKFYDLLAKHGLR